MSFVRTYEFMESVTGRTLCELRQLAELLWLMVITHYACVMDFWTRTMAACSALSPPCRWCLSGRARCRGCGARPHCTPTTCHRQPQLRAARAGCPWRWCGATSGQARLPWRSCRVS